MKLLIVGDIHCDFVGPKNRSENFYNCFIEKIKQIEQIANVCDIDNIVCLGDFFENYVVDYFERIIFDLSTILSKRNWYSLVGNHDNKKVDGTDIRGTSFGALVATGLLKEAKHLPNILQNVNCDIFDYYNRENFDKNKKFDDKLSIAFIHEFVMPENTNENFDFKKCEESNYDFVFCGHYHYDFDEKVGKTRYINPGSLMRLTINKKDADRNPKIIIFDTETRELDYVLLETKNDVFLNNTANEEKLLNFNSKFTEMLIDKNLTQGNSNDIITLLKKNNVDEKIVKYIQKKTEEIENEH